ncbi:MAG: class I SAM-dependent methyltransferase [Pirellulales bacterium]|nr:class I SAM-dependent methyltransferase [Pirellulales bacterium]
MSAISKIKAKILVLARPAVRFFRPPPPSHLKPVSRRWGFERGTAISRYMIDRFIEANRADITGVVLEIKNRRYTDGFGHGVTEADVLDVDSSNSDANVITDLATADVVESNRYDCFILTETLQFVYDLPSAIAHAHRILKPGGVLLVSVPNTGPADDELFHTDYWRLTGLACERLFGDVFGKDQVQVELYGNFATCVAGLSGLAAEELDQETLDSVDPKYTQGVFVRAQKHSAD